MASPPMYYLYQNGAPALGGYHRIEDIAKAIQGQHVDWSSYSIKDMNGQDVSQQVLPQISQAISQNIPNANPYTPPSQTSQTSGIQPPIIPSGPNMPSVPLDYPPLQTIPGLSTPETPINASTAPSDISPYIPTTSQQQQDVINQSIAQSGGIANQNFQDLQQSIAPYIQSQVQQGIGQSQDLSRQNFNQLTDLIGPWIQEQFGQYTNPNSPGYQKLSGELNNFGVASGGAFPQALADKLAPLISQGALDLGRETLTPSFTNQQGMLAGGLQAIGNQIPSIFNPSYANQQSLVGQGAGVQSNLGLDSLNRFIQQADWEKQKNLANDLAAKGASAQLGSGVGGLLGGGLGAYAGNALFPAAAGGTPYGMMIGAGLGLAGGKAAGGGVGGLSWICNHMMKLGHATQEEVDAIHTKLWPTILHHPAEWFAYLILAPYLISCVDEPWEPIKKMLIDAVIAESDSEAAWQIYRAECKRLTLTHAPLLWALEANPCH